MIVRRLLSWMLRYRVGRALYMLFYNLDMHHAPVAASAMAFDAFLSLIPLAAIAGYVLHRLNESGDVVLTPLLEAAPRPVIELFGTAFLRLSEGGVAVLAPVSVAAFLWTSSAGLSTAMSVFETVFHSPPRPFWLRRLIAILLVLAGVAALAAITFLSILVASLGDLPGRIVAMVVPPASLVALLSGFLRVAIRGKKRRVLPGALVTTALWAVLSALFSLYVAKLARYATLYGSLAAVAIFLFWLWLIAIAVLVGGEVNAQLDGIREVPAEVSSHGFEGL